MLDSQLGKRQIYELCDNTNFSKIAQNITDYLEKGDTIEELAGKLYIDHTLAWMIYLIFPIIPKSVKLEISLIK